MSRLNLIAAELLNSPMACSQEYADTMLSSLSDRIGIDAPQMEAGDFTARSDSLPAGVPANVGYARDINHELGGMDSERAHKRLRVLNTSVERLVLVTASDHPDLAPQEVFRALDRGRAPTDRRGVPMSIIAATTAWINKAA